MMLKWLITSVVVYGGFVALVYLAQRSLQYFPERRRTAPWAVGLANAEEVVLDTADGERVIVWHVPPRNAQPVFVYLHGNGGSLRWREERLRDPLGGRSGRVALGYRGYGGSSGRPTEAADNRVGCLVLEAAFTSAVDVGAQHYWFVPVRLLMKDRFRSDLRASMVTAPVLVVHGEND